MPISIQQALLFISVFVIVVALLTATTYTLVTNMLTDAYRYLSILEKSNEKIRVVGVNTGMDLYCGVRNLGLTKVTIKELGVVDIAGHRHVLATDVELDPGEAFTKKAGPLYGMVYVVTERGNVFSAPIINLGTVITKKTVDVRTLLPSLVQVGTNLKYFSRGDVALSFGTYGYFFGFLFVDDPHSNKYILLTFGPINVPNLFKNGVLHYSATKYGVSGPIYTQASLDFQLEPGNGKPYYRIVMPVLVERTDSQSGLLIRGCFGFIWRTITNSMYGIKLVTQTPSICTYNPQYGKVCDELHTLVIPTAGGVESLLPVLASASPTSMFLEAPTGAQTYIILAKCFYIESDKLSYFSTTLSRPYATVYGVRINTYLNFPGTTYVGDQNLALNAVTVELDLSPQALVLSLLNGV